MVLVLGTDAGFVTTAPTADPESQSNLIIDTSSRAGKFVSPADSARITEMGWHSKQTSEEANFEVGIYSHDAGNNRPGELLFVSATNAKGTTEGWKVVTGLNWEISGNTTYWLAVQVDDTATQTKLSTNYDTSQIIHHLSSSTSLPSSWGTSSGSYTHLAGIYAVWEAAPPSGTNQWINVDDAWRQLSEAWVNIDDSWRKVKEAWINVDDVWRKLYSV